MKNNRTKPITIFEHEALYVHKGAEKLTEPELEALQRFYKEDNFPYYTLVNNGVRFCEYVGIIQVGKLVIEVLPKIDEKDQKSWQKILLDMLKVSGFLKVSSTSSANLRLQSNSILDLYFEIFIRETEAIFHKGLVKRYRLVEGNQNNLKGSLLFSRQIKHNLVHEYRFYTRHTVYDETHLLNCILYKAITLLDSISTSPALNSRIKALLLSFPELPNVNLQEATFSRISFNRKTEPYKDAIAIAKLLLLNFHPDLTSGNHYVLALMFDMNELWERFILSTLKKKLPEDYEVRAQVRKTFWKRDGGSSKRIIPDIIIRKPDQSTIVLDTKWKNIGDWNPTDDDLRQMYAYSKFHDNAATFLVYPSDSLSKVINGRFFDELHNEQPSLRTCSIVKLSVHENISEWRTEIGNFFKGLL